MNEYMSPCGHDVWVEKEGSDKSGYIEFITTLNDGCWSYVGKQGTSKQQIAIGYMCNTKGTILHEMLHTMGFLHEQQRCDRDSYIEIIKPNINNMVGGKKYNAMAQFECQYSIQQTHYSSPYDIFSIMHYDLWAFSKKLKRTSNTKTMKLKQEFMNLTIDIEELIGKMGRMSDTDKQEVNALYGCIAPTCVVSCNGTNTCAELPPTPNDKMRAQAIIIKSLTYLVSGKVVANIKKLDKEFRVYLKLHPNVYSKKLHNVIHLAVGSSKTSRGEEILGVWFSDAGDGRLNITVPTTKKYFITDPQPTNSFCTIDILQQYKEKKYIYIIKINAENVYSEQNPLPKLFNNVQVYASNPWDLVQDTYIEGMFIINGKKDQPSMIDLVINPTDQVAQLSRKELCENEVIGTMSSLEKAYSVSFKLKPYSYSKGWENVLHVTKGQNYGECGDRNPAVFFHKDGSGRLVFFSAINGNINSEFETKNPLPLNVWSSIRIEQTLKNQPSMIDLVINPTDQVAQLSRKELCENEVIGTMSSLEKAYSVSFKLKPYSYSKGWENVLHVTKGQNYGECGDRNPAVFFHKDGSGRLVFFSAINGNINSEFETKNPLPLNVWSSIRIEQTLKNQPSMIDLVINPTDQVAQLSRKELCENEVIGTMSSLEKAYSVSFKLKPYSYSKGWENVLHVTKGQNYGECGDRNPAVFFHKDGSGRLVFFSAINGNINSEFETKNPLPLNVWSSIRIEQTLKNSAYVYAIYVNGSIQYEIENKDPRQFKDVKVYISDPWYTAHDGDIKELFVVNRDTKSTSDRTQPLDKFEGAKEQKLQENNLVATISLLSTRFTVSFQINPTSYSIGKHSVFYFMQDRSLSQQANKKISAWFHEDGSGRLVIAVGFSYDLKKLTEFTTKDSLPLNQWSSIKLTRTKAISKDKTIFNIYLDEKRIFNVEKEAESLEFVRVFFGDPWNSVQNGYFKDLKIYNN
ncbi:uncharacterized protein LOC136079842 isoform X2 [Hydra vulgaris]